VTSDHGEATGELGRISHSTIIYPEVMRVPLIVHLPHAMRAKYVHDENQISTLIDIAPTLYYLLGHRPIKPDPLVGRPMFVENAEEYQSYPRPDLFLASDSLAAYGILAGDGRWMYTTYDSPSRSMLFDLVRDPKAQNSVLTPEFKKQYDDRILQYLQLISKFYGHHPTGG
jgi:arylsulfatase A-like enzyme